MFLREINIMATPFVGEIRMFAGNFAPRGNSFCNGQLLPIAQNTALFSILGTTYGGNGTTNFGLPNLQGRAPMHFGQGPGLSLRSLGETGGQQNVTLTGNQIASHQHLAMADTGSGTTPSPSGATWATVSSGRGSAPLYVPAPPNVTMNPNALGQTGGNQPHNNMPPYLAITFIIGLQGIFPARN